MECEPAPLSAHWDRRPAGVPWLRWFGIVIMAASVVGSAVADPGPGLHGDGRWVAIAIVVFVAGIPLAARRRVAPGRWTFPALLAVAVASVLLIVLQGEQSSAITGIYFATIIAAVQLPLRRAAIVGAIAVGGGALAYALTVPDASDQVISILLGVPPWFIVVRVMRELRQRQAAAEALVEELRESREAQAAAAALAERGRLARDMHDVLAHSLSALALQLEGARLLAVDRRADPAVVDAVERAHHLATTGLDEARRAIGALRGDALPGPERLSALAAAFEEQSAAACSVTVTGEPRELNSEARLAIYRTAQEALTNVRRHAAATRVDVALAYAPDGVELRVQDHGVGAPVTVGGSGGYGLTGMRERAELLGGSLEAGPTDDGFRVAMWLPA